MTNEQRIGRMARKAAKIIIQLRKDGEQEAARKLEAAAIEAAEQMRAGLL